MKKTMLSMLLILTMVLGLLTSCSMDQKSTNEENVTEEVSWVLTYEKEQYSDEFDNPSIAHEGYFEYDSLGRLISEKLVYSSRNITGTNFEYDENANVVYKSGTYNDYYSGESSYSYTYTYDNNNNCIREFVDWTSATDDITYEYDEHGNVIKEHSVYTSDSGITETTCYMSLRYENDMCVQNEMTIDTTVTGMTNTIYALKQYIYDDNGNKEKELYYTDIENKNDAKNPVQINGRYYKLYSSTEYTYKNLNDVAVKPNSDAEQSVETTTKINLSDSVDKVLASGYEANGDYYELVANESENYNGVKIEVGVIKNNEWLLSPTSKMPFIDDDGTLYGNDIKSIYDANAKLFYIGNGCFLCESKSKYECIENIIYNSETKQYYENKNTHICITYDCLTGFYGITPDYSKLKMISNEDSLIITGLTNYGDTAILEILNTNTMQVMELKINAPDNWNKIGYVYPISEGIFAVANDYSNHNKIAFYDKDGNNIIKNDYALQTSHQSIIFENGKCTFTIYNNNNNIYEITIDKEGNVIHSKEL